MLNTQKSAAGQKTAPCPQCNKPAVLGTTNRWRPFCSRECKLLDFGDWLDEFGLNEDGEPGAAPPRDNLS